MFNYIVLLSFTWLKVFSLILSVVKVLLLFANELEVFEFLGKILLYENKLVLLPIISIIIGSF